MKSDDQMEQNSRQSCRGATVWPRFGLYEGAFISQMGSVCSKLDASRKEVNHNVIS